MIKTAPAPPSTGGKKMLNHADIQCPEISPELRLANAAFERDLPDLIDEGKSGKWVAYIGDKRVGVEEKKSTLVRRFIDELRAKRLLVVQVKNYPAFESMSF